MTVENVQRCAKWTQNRIAAIAPGVETVKTVVLQMPYISAKRKNSFTFWHLSSFLRKPLNVAGSNGTNLCPYWNSWIVSDYKTLFLLTMSTIWQSLTLSLTFFLIQIFKKMLFSGNFLLFILSYQFQDLILTQFFSARFLNNKTSEKLFFNLPDLVASCKNSQTSILNI